MSRVGVGCVLGLWGVVGAVGCGKDDDRRCYKSGDAAACERLCAQGRGRACFTLGERHWYTGARQDHDVSFRWYGKACALRRKLPRTVYTSSPAQSDERYAVAMACTKLGALHERPSEHAKGKPAVGSGKRSRFAPRKPDRLRATLFHRRACELGLAEACKEVAQAFHHGRGAPTDLRSAWRYYARACDLGLEHGCVMAAQVARAHDRKRR